MDELFRILPKIMEQLDDSEHVREAVVFAAWRKAAGDSLSKHTKPECLREKRLTILVRDKTWKRHLETLAGQMIFKLNSILGKAIVTFIEFKIDEKAINEYSKRTGGGQMSDEKHMESALEEVTSSLRESANVIADEELRTQFLLAAGSCLARKKRREKVN